MVKVVNGLDVEALGGLVDTVKKQPQIAKAVFYATTFWKSGFHNEAAVSEFSLGGQKVRHQQTFWIVGDHAAETLGTGKGAASVEIILAALGHCLAGGWATFAATMGIAIEQLRVEVEGDMDLQGMLGLPEPGAVRPGFQEIRATYYVKSTAPREKLEQVAKMAEDFSPTRDTLRAVKFTSRLIVE